MRVREALLAGVIAVLFTLGLSLMFRPARAQSPCYAVDVWANQCAGSSEGQTFKATDGPLHGVYSAGAWQYFFNDFPARPLVNNSVYSGAPAFSWVNRATAIERDLGGCVYLEAPKASAPLGNLSLYNAPAPAAPYKWSVPMLLNLTGGGDDAGIAVRASSTGRLVTLSLKGGLIYVFHMTDPTHYAGSAVGGVYFGYMYPLIYQVEDDGTNLYFRWSNDGHNFITVWQEARTSWLAGAPDGNAIYVDADANDYPTGGTFCGYNYN